MPGKFVVDDFDIDDDPTVVFIFCACPYDAKREVI